MYFVDRDGDRLKAVANVGESLLDVAVNNDVELEGTCRNPLCIYIYIYICVCHQ